MAKNKVKEGEVLENEAPKTKAPAKREKPVVEELPVEEDLEPDYDVDRTGSCGCDEDCPCCGTNQKIYTLLEILKSGTLDEDQRQIVQKKLMDLVEDF
jgi:hypothetical protein